MASKAVREVRTPGAHERERAGERTPHPLLAALFFPAPPHSFPSRSHTQYGKVVRVDLKTPSRPPAYAFVEFDNPQ